MTAVLNPIGGGLVRGGPGEVALRDIMQVGRPVMRANGTKAAREFEELHPGVVVVCDWEILSDSDIAQLSPEAQRAALQDRVYLEHRRQAAAKIERRPDQQRGGDPERVAEELRRARIDMQLLNNAHPEYERLFNDFASKINGLEAALIADGVIKGPPTEFKIGTPPPKAGAPELTEDQELELNAKVEAYKALSVGGRRKSIEAAVDPNLTRMLLKVEGDEKIREAIIMKLYEMGATG